MRVALAMALLSIALPAWSQTEPPPLADDEGLPRIVVGPQGFSLMRVAVAPTRCEGGGAVCKEVHAQLNRNLQVALYFELLKPETFIPAAAEAPLGETNYPDWNSVGARHLIKSEVSGSGPYTVELRLHDVLDGKVLPVKGQSHTGLSAKAVHGAVDEFLNSTVEALTGKKGLFGSRLVFAIKTGKQTRGVGIVEMDGADQGGIVGGDTISMLPSFAGGGVLYTSFRDGKPDLYIGKKKLTNNPHHYRGASMGPSGTIAAALSKGSGTDIYLLDGGGNPTTRLTNGEGQNVSPTWSPDGGKLAFVSDRSGGPQVYVMSAGGGGATRVTMAGGYNSTPSWGSNGLIAFAAMTGSGSDILTTDEGGNMQRITQNQGTNTDPCWSPDAQYLAFVSAREGGKRIYISTPDGRYQFPITEKSGGYSTPRWGK